MDKFIRIRSARLNVEQIEAYFPTIRKEGEEEDKGYNIGVKLKSGNNLLIWCESEEDQLKNLKILDDSCGNDTY